MSGTVMVLRFHGSPPHEEAWMNGHNTAAMRASVESALHAAADLDATEIIVSTIGPTVILEGFVSQWGDSERALAIAEDIVGSGYVHCRLLVR
jgi:osmotically-inducible protein OsmY